MATTKYKSVKENNKEGYTKMEVERKWIVHKMTKALASFDYA